MPCPSRSRTVRERLRTLQVAGDLAARSGARTSAPLSITAIGHARGGAQDPVRHRRHVRAASHCHSQATPGQVGLGERRLVDRERAPKHRPPAESARRLDDGAAKGGEPADDSGARALERGQLRGGAVATTTCRMAGLEAGVALGATMQATAAAAQSARATALIHGAIGTHHSNEHPGSRDGAERANTGRRARRWRALRIP